MAAVADASVEVGSAGPARRDPLYWSGRMLVAASWLSAAIFGAYILVFYGGAVPRGALGQWNGTLPRLYEAHTPLATIAIGAHFVTGGILLLLGPVQLVAALRDRLPAVHRWLGRAYVLSAGLAGVGGLGFILAKGTVGGPIMDVGFGLYGVLTVLAAEETFRHARGGRRDIHRAWGIRLFALAIGSWLYRMEYGFWFMLTDRLGHTSGFSGWFDHLMAFFFYLPNLAVAELFIHARRTVPGTALRLAATAALAAATGFIVLATCFFTANYWGPAILASAG
jgi:hypothetical protein